MSLSLILAAVLATATPDCAARVAEAQAAIDHANTDWLRALKAGDAAAIAAAYADDGVFVTGDGRVLVGRPAVQALYAERTAAPLVGGGIVSQGLACAGDDLIYEWGEGEVRRRDAAGRETARTGPYMTVWRRTGDGWKILRNLSF